MPFDVNRTSSRTFDPERDRRQALVNRARAGLALNAGSDRAQGVLQLSEKFVRGDLAQAAYFEQLRKLVNVQRTTGGGR